MQTPPAWPWPFWLYRFGGEIGAPLIAAAVRHKYRDGRFAEHNIQRFGHAQQSRPDGRLVWVHAASLGETQSVLGLLNCLREARSDWHFLLTHWTESAAGLAQSAAFAPYLSAFFPIDTGPVRRRFLQAWRPDAALFVESEIWPGWVDALHRQNIPLALINARLSEKSAERWGKWPGLAQAITGRMPQILAQNQDVADRFAKLGAGANQITVTGDLKSAAPPPEIAPEIMSAWQGALGARPCWAAASTHEGEEAPILAAHAKLRQTHDNAALILIPRHPERADDLAKMAAANGLSVLRYSEGTLPQQHHSLILADGFGAMGLWYRLSSLVFMGGSLVNLGGHNPFEPARLHNALLTGPLHSNFKESYARFAAAGGAEIITAETLGARVTALLASPAVGQMADAAAKLAGQAEDIPARARDALLNGALKGI